MITFTKEDMEVIAEWNKVAMEAMNAPQDKVERMTRILLEVGEVVMDQADFPAFDAIMETYTNYERGLAKGEWKDRMQTGLLVALYGLGVKRGMG